MNRIKAIGGVVFDLFVEDARLTVALAVWLAIVAATRPWWREAPHTAAIGLFVGCALILCGNVAQAARRKR